MEFSSNIKQQGVTVGVINNIKQMSRTQSYRGKMPIHILQLLDVASRITLFLVGQNGPLCFVFKDRLDNKFKTSIGSSLKCSCSSNRNDHCIHTIYVLLKIFKIAPQNPLMWQSAYVDSELNDILSGKHTILENRRIIRPIFEPSEQELPSKYLSQLRETSYITVAKVQRMVLNEESVCPICQQLMKQDMCLSYCKVKCGNNFHLECLKIWAEHKSTTEAAITCPMCRASMGKNFLKQITEEQKKFSTRQLKKVQFKCSGCGVNPIPNSPHKCVLCTSYELCECCYQSNKHIKHPFIRRVENLKWQGAPQRRQNELKIKNYIQNRRKETTNQQLLQKLRKVEEDPSKLIDFIASAYPYVSKFISDNIQPNKQLGFNAQDMKCMKCGSKKMIFLRRLNCGHFVDHECLKEWIRLGKFHCQEDGSKFAKGYEHLIQIQKQIQSPYVANYSSQFDPSKLEVVEQPTLNEIFRGYSNDQQSQDNNQIRQRVASNLVNNLVTSRQVGHSRFPEVVRPSVEANIRVRQVSKSGNRKDRSESQQRKKKVTGKDMQRMLQFMIGRKVF